MQLKSAHNFFVFEAKLKWILGNIAAKVRSNSTSAKVGEIYGWNM